MMLGNGREKQKQPKRKKDLIDTILAVSVFAVFLSLRILIQLFY